MLRKSQAALCRRSVAGPGSTFSATKYGQVDLNVACANKAPLRLENQKHIQNDTERERKYALCRKCGVITIVVNFDKVPSARLGLWGRCKGGMDYTHHEFVALSKQEYYHAADKSKDERLTWFHFER